jgi:hypothetical protein
MDHDVDTRALQRDAILTAVTGVGLVAGVVAGLLDAPPWVAGAAYLIAYLAGGLPAGVEACARSARARSTSTC